MHLDDLNLLIGKATLPKDVRALLREADRRIRRFRTDHNVPAFITSDYPIAYATLRALVESDLAPNDLFCEWGSGYGVVACLAAMLGFDAAGIEIEADLVHAAQEFADDRELPVQFVHGSYIPLGDGLVESPAGYAWLTTEEGRAYEELGLDLADFGVVFAYPWPDEEDAVADLFARHAGPGAVLVTYHGIGGLRLRQRPVS